MSTENNTTCATCGRMLQTGKDRPFCPHCDTESPEPGGIFSADDGYIFVECPGATLYAPGTDQITAGVKWRDHSDPSKGYDIIGHAVYAPNHTKKRRVKKEAYGKIRRCQACQDFTIRMRRKEGPDFFIPSPRHPRRKKLRPVQYVTRAPR